MWPFSRKNDAEERPPKPEPTDEVERFDMTRYEATVEYRNGEVETFECYGVYSRSDHYITFNTDPYATKSYRGSASHSFDRRKIHYETLAREPTLEELATDTFVLTWTADHEWKSPWIGPYNADKDWMPTAADIELTVERDD